MQQNKTLNNITTSSLNRFPLLAAFIRIWMDSREAFVEERTHLKCLEIAIGLLTCFGRRTISRGICAMAKQFIDWSRFYRFFSKDKWSLLILEHKLLAQLGRHLKKDAPLVVAVDDTHEPKTGKKIPSSGYFYDAKSPRFARSFKWQIRFLTLSVLLTPHGIVAAARGILLKLKLAPKLKKPGKRASEQEWAQYKQMAKIWTITTQLIEQVHLLRCQMDAIADLAKRLLVIVADASYCNRTIIRDLPKRCILISRTRRDLVLFEPVDGLINKLGRKRIYGRRLPSPEETRQDDSIPWKRCTIFAGGSWHELRYKSVAPVLWKSAGSHPLRLIVIAPLGYRLRKKSKLLYRNPAYLLVSDVEYPVHLAIQHYFHRWEIEVNHRDAKSTLGVGDAQVRNPRSVARQFSFAALIGSWLSVASLDAYGPERREQYVPHPKWRNDSMPRPSSLDLVTRLRLEMLMYETGEQVQEFYVDRGFAPNTPEYAQAAAVWLASTVPKGISESFWSSILYADA
jgi:cell division protein FtsB